ncbi:MAG: hypothetical protein ACM3XM_14665 [Mycobacterium leprae]
MSKEQKPEQAKAPAPAERPGIAFYVFAFIVLTAVVLAVDWVMGRIYPGH